MPVSKIKISFVSVGVADTADIWGDDTWGFSASINGDFVGNVMDEFTARDKGIIVLPAKWSAEIDVSQQTKFIYGVKVKFAVIKLDGVDSLGEVSYEFKYPFARGKTISIDSPVQHGLFADHQYYTLQVRLDVLEVKSFKPKFGSWQNFVKASRQNKKSKTFTTVSVNQVLPRVEVCPVVPSPEWPSMMPKRPDIAIKSGLWPGLDTPQNAPVTLWPLPPLNSTYNPSLIPIIPKTDPDFAKKVAKLAVTYFEPGDLDLSKLTWKVKTGPSEIVGSNKGVKIKLLGTGSGASDQLTEVEVRWDGRNGPLLATFRAWVGNIKTAMYRINLINGPTPATSVAFPPQDYKNQVEMARCLYWQAGIALVPDTDTTCWDGATRTDPSTGAALPPGVFIVPVTDPTLTVNVNNFAPTPASRLNCRPGVLHAVYVCSTPAPIRAAATDIQGVDGQDYALGGTPSSSWGLPSGVPPDDPAGTLTMKTFASSNRPSKKAVGDDAYVTARHAVDPSFTAASMAKIYAAVLPSAWTTVFGSGTDPNAGVNVGHELGHVLGLMHRGHTNQSKKGPFGSDDKIDCMGMDGVARGHPWHENIMTYGYAGNTGGVTRAQDIDLLQTAVIRKHPACK